jgi:tRNA (guanine37-N1)-methyltransferase
MKIDVLTLFPEMIEQALSYSIPARAQAKKIVEVRAHQLRQWAIDRHGNVDDTPYGGGPGMILRVDVAHAAFEAVDHAHRARRIMLSPDGQRFDQKMAEELTESDQLVFLCGRYEGFDARIEKYVDMKVSVGPYVLSGGELPTLTIIDAITRLLPGVLGNEESLSEETFGDDLTEYPQYTRPNEYKGQKVPEILLTGHHAEIAAWRQNQRRKTNSKR